MEPLRLDLRSVFGERSSWDWTSLCKSWGLGGGGGGGNLNCVALIDMRGGGLTFGFSKSGRSALLGVGP